VKKRGPSPWAIAVVATVVVATAVCVVNGARRVGESFPGFLVAENRTVLSVGRPGWSIERVPRAFFSQVIAFDRRPITRAGEIQAAIAELPAGTPVSYRFRKGADIFGASLEVQRFTFDDFITVYGTYAAVGLVFSLAGLWAVWRTGEGPLPAAVTAFFLLCQSVGFALGTAGDVYGPYWFVPLYFGAQCATIATLVHLAVSFPQPLGLGSGGRRFGLGLVYAASLALAFGLTGMVGDVSLFVPLLYVVYLLLANATFLYLAALATGLSVSLEPEDRTSLRWAIAGALAVVVLPAMIFLVYPILQRSISPIALVGPLVLFPLLTAPALPRERSLEARRTSTSVRLRLSVLFLGAVETAFLIAVAVFWQNNSWAQLLDDLTLNERRRTAVQLLRLAEPAALPTGIEQLGGLAQTVAEDEHTSAANTALRRGDAAAVERELAALGAFYDGVAARLESRRRSISALGIPVLAALLAIAVLQAVAFTLAVRRWLIRPLDRVAAATNVIATGDLAHRLEPEHTEEFSNLGRAVNSMAASLQAIQRRVELARAARQRAAGAARDAERRRLARELHDGILQDLSAVRLGLEKEAAAGEAPQRDPATAISGVIAALRGVVDDLRPPALSAVSLEEAIAGHARLATFARGIELSLDLTAAATVPEWAARDLYRIAQEATANALRHANGKRLWIRLVLADADTILEVEDDGVGFDVATAPLGSGVQGMRERAAVLGGDLEIGPGAFGGTRVRFVARLQPGSPLDAPERA
jgi:two-component system sensor histidine kinase UhpB